MENGRSGAMAQFLEGLAEELAKNGDEQRV
jgi:hypothetical protein